MSSFIKFKTIKNATDPIENVSIDTSGVDISGTLKVGGTTTSGSGGGFGGDFSIHPATNAFQVKTFNVEITGDDKFKKIKQITNIKIPLLFRNDPVKITTNSKEFWLDNLKNTQTSSLPDYVSNTINDSNCYVAEYCYFNIFGPLIIKTESDLTGFCVYYSNNKFGYKKLVKNGNKYTIDVTNSDNKFHMLEPFRNKINNSTFVTKTTTTLLIFYTTTNDADAVSLNQKISYKYPIVYGNLNSQFDEPMDSDDNHDDSDNQDYIKTNLKKLGNFSGSENRILLYLLDVHDNNGKVIHAIGYIGQEIFGIQNTLYQSSNFNIVENILDTRVKITHSENPLYVTIKV